VTQSRPRRLLLLAACAVLLANAAGAQERRWEVELFGGIVAGGSTADGTRTLPPAGAPLVTTTPIFPSREVPSWFFGDGAALLNSVAGELGAAARIAPLDPLFGPGNIARTGVAGVRMRRRLSPRMSAEIAVDWLGQGSSAPSDFATTVDAARSSYTAAMGQVLATGPFSAVLVEATASSDQGSRREFAATGALNADFRGFGGLTPYATFGGGILAGTGALPSADLTGRSRFLVLGEVPIDESERMALRFERPPAFVIVLGGGLRRDISERWGLRVDVRALLGPDATRIVVDSETASVRGAPTGFVESFTNPAIQFSNDPSTGRRSTLSAPPLQSFRVFSGGIRTRTTITVGISRRF
jgi:hypothetical protein